MGRLQIKALGTPEVQHEGRTIKFRSRKVLALLLYLAVEGQKVSREKISALLWPESDEGSARATLRRALADLREALDETPTHTHLLIERDALGFAFATGDELDVRGVDTAFDLLHRSTTAESHAIGRQELFVSLLAAVRLARGGFMEGFSLGDALEFENWVDEQRAACQRRMSLIYERLAQMQAEQGDVPGAIETVNRWLAHDPLSEVAYQRLMLLYLTAGNYRAGLNAYEDCRRILAKELGTRPLPETQSLAERIRRAAEKGTLGLGSGDRAVANTSAKGTINRPIGGMGGEDRSRRAVPFGVQMVGRASEHLALVEIYEEVRQGQARVAIITGETGIGKTRLTREFLGWAEARGADVLQGRAFETGGRLPYQPIVESFRPRLERENAPDDLLSDTWLAELTRLFPELRDRYPDLPPATGDEMTARVRLYEAITRLGQALTDKVPVVLFLDDLQWADAATLDVLYYAVRRWQESHTPILLLLNLRSEHLAATGDLAGWMARLEHDMQAMCLHLDALTFEETLQLLETLALNIEHHERIEAFGRWLFAETGGQPLYVTETLKALLERGLLAGVTSSDGQWRIDFLSSTVSEGALRRFLPPGVREVIRVRLSQLAPDSFALLAASAVLGHDASFEQLCRVAGLDEQAGLAALDELLQSRFLREGSNGEVASGLAWETISSGTYFFTHDKARDVVYSEAGEARRRVFHRHALEMLQSATAAERVQHALGAGLLAQAFSLSVSAGDDAMRMFAVNDASGFYERALHLLPRLSESELLPVIRQLYSQLGRAYELTNRTEDAERTYQDMLTYARQGQAIGMECAALSRMAVLEVQVRLDFEQAKALLRQALERAEQVNDRALMADVEWHLAQIGFYDFDAPTIVMHGERALAIARELGDTELIARCLNVLSYGKKQNGSFSEAESYAREAVTLFQRLGNRAMEVDSMCLVADILLNQGRVEEGVALARTAYELSLKIGNAWSQVNAMYHLAFGALERGAYEEAFTLAERCVALTEEFKLQVLVVASYALLGIAQRAIGEIDAACATHMRAIESGQQMSSPALIAAAAMELCTDYALLGRWDDASACALSVVRGKSHLFVLVFGLSRWYVTEALIRAGHMDLAIDDLGRWRARVEESPRHRIPYLRAVAMVAQSQGQAEEAHAALQEALSLAHKLQLVSEEREIEALLQASS